MGHQLDSFSLQKLQTKRHVLQLLGLDTRLLVPLRQLLGRNHLQKIAKLHSIGKVPAKVLNFHHALNQKSVAPTRKGTLLDFNPPINTSQKTERKEKGKKKKKKKCKKRENEKKEN